MRAVFTPLIVSRLVLVVLLIIIKLDEIFFEVVVFVTFMLLRHRRFYDKFTIMLSIDGLAGDG